MNRFTRPLVLLVALQLPWGYLLSQASSTVFARKAPGERITLAWDYPVREEWKIKGFLVKWSSSAKGPYYGVVAVKPDCREIEFEVTFASGASRSFYVVVALAGNEETLPTNPVGLRRK